MSCRRQAIQSSIVLLGKKAGCSNSLLVEVLVPGTDAHIISSHRRFIVLFVDDSLRSFQLSFHLLLDISHVLSVVVKVLVLVGHHLVQESLVSSFGF